MRRLNETEVVIITNTLELNERQEELLYTIVKSWFEKKYTSDYNHFEFIGTNLKSKSSNWLAFYEIWTDDDMGFLLSIEINDSKRPLKRTISATSIDDDLMIRVL
tara:strand:+ start:5110 stop:5424 length:315 start_codon:yes stop_codon:yes gene_type:complete